MKNNVIAASEQAEPSEMMQAALGYAARDLPVFPVPAGTKKSHKSAKHSDGRAWGFTTEPDEIRRDFTNWPDANIGIVTGSLSRIFVVDLDTAEGHRADGIGNFDRLADQHGGVPETATASTPSGGRHLYFRWPDSLVVRSSAGKLLPGVDIRGDGGMVLAPPSAKPGVGVYAWTKSPDTTPIADAPEWLLEEIRKVSIREVPAATPRSRADDKGRVAPMSEVREALRAINPDTPRDPWLQVLMALHWGFGDDALEAAEEWSLGAPGRYVEGCVEDAFRSFARGETDAQITLATLFRRAEAGGADLAKLKHTYLPDRWFDVVEPETIDLPAVVDLAAFRKTEEARFFAEAEAVADVVSPARNGTRSLVLMTFDEAADSALDASAEPLVDDLLDVGAMSVFYGASNARKTFLVLDLAFAVATGRPWDGRETKRSGVLYLALEGGGGIRKRFAALKREHPDADASRMMLASESIDLCNSKDDYKAVIEAANSIPGGCGLIVIDTLSRAMAGGDENSPVDMGRFIAITGHIRAATGAHVLAIHHSGKDRERGARGHSNLKGAVDTEIEIAVVGDAVGVSVITDQKQRDRVKQAPREFGLRNVYLGEDSKGRPVSSAVVHFRDPAQPAEAASMAEEAQANGERVFLKLLRDFNVHGRKASVSTGHRYAPSEFARHPDSEGCSKELLRLAMESLLSKHAVKVVEGGPPSRRTSWLEVADQGVFG